MNLLAEQSAPTDTTLTETRTADNATLIVKFVSDLEFARDALTDIT
jgi:hypothetical protein